MHDTQAAQSPTARALVPRTPGQIVRATVGGRVETFVDGRTLGELMVAGAASELDYMGDAAGAALDLEGELTLDAAAGVDVRARLVGGACSPSELVDWDALTPVELAAIIEADLREGLGARISASARWTE